MSKPLVYADQNVLGLHLHGKLNLARASEIQWAYSKEHFEEIRRSADAAQYLAVLDQIGAKMLDLELSSWRLTGAARLIEGGTAEQHFADYCDALHDVDCDANLFAPLQVWMNGGGDESLLQALPRQILKQLQILTESLPDSAWPKQLDSLERDFIEVMGEMAASGNAIDSTRAALGIGKGAVGSVSGANQIQKIWNIIAPAPGGITIDQFFGFDPPNKQGYESWPIYLGIIGCCAVLDVLGFQAEKKCRRIDMLPNVRSDAVHIAMGAYCSAMLSLDKRLFRRAEAIYEYKNIGTQCFLISVAA